MEGTNKPNNKNKRHNDVTFKPYVQNQAWMLPPTLDELIGPDHLVRLINDVIDGMDLKPIMAMYKGGGSSAYHPRMLLKALVYGYVEKKYSTREIEKAIRENICFMWICGMEQPDHNTLNRFRNSRLKQTVKEVFAYVLAMLVEQGYVKLEEYYIDGTKIESVAGRYTYVWAKNVERYKGALLDKIAQIIQQIEAVNEQVEAEASKRKDKVVTPSINASEVLKQTIEQLNEQLKDQLGENKKLKGQLDKLEKEHLPKLQQYEEQEDLLAGRNSYSKTDPDATFMRTKDDHFGNGQMKPSYNIQLGTEKQFIINYTVHQTPADISTFIDHLDNTSEMLEKIDASLPKRICGDAGYGSEQNYEYLEEKHIDAYVKYSGYYQEQRGKQKNNPFHSSNLYYNSEQDYYVCPMGQHMTLRYITEDQTKSGYMQTIHVYQAQRCEGCPLRGLCHQSNTDRMLQVNHRSAQYRKAARQRLNSLRGIRMRNQRGIEVESVFGQIKQNRHFRRFTLTGLDGVSTQLGLLALAHNLKKWWVNQCERGCIGPLPPAMSAKCIPLRQTSEQIRLDMNTMSKMRA
jgi:transposase